ncbi:MAG: diguanylate cyclase/phosphodiesterase & domain with sensor(s) [Deltaproteobacteria bacterium]|nr:diguanylate cyclase/phosphodiesterase & domain with sensor(s) [Deltaproteobacteria bacterium]
MRAMDADMDDDATVMGANAQKLGLLSTDRAYLIVIAGTLAGKLIPLTEPMILGRGGEADVRIVKEEMAMSRKHCRLFLVEGEAYIEDLQSSNGTYVNGRRIVRERLRDGDKIQVGETTILKFTSDDDNLEEAFRRQNSADQT